MTLAEADMGTADLTDALLEQVFAFVCLVQRQGSSDEPAYRRNSAIPQVCKRWNRVYTSSTVLWARLALDWSEVLEEFLLAGAHTLLPRYGYASKWVADRAPYITELHYSGCSVLGPSLELQLFRLARLGSRLRSVQLLDVAHSADGLLAQLAQCGTLRELGIHCQRQAEGPIQQLTVSAGALKAIGALADLRSLTLNVDKVLGNTRDVGEALSKLTQFRFMGRREAVVLHPDLICTLSNLRHLELGNCRLGQFTPRTAEVLSHVTFLGVTDVLAAKPRKKAGTTLWEGLRYLDSLAQLRVQDQDFGGMPANAIDCTALRGLTLIRSAADDWPGPSHLVANPNCLGTLQSLHLSELRLEQPIHPQFWHSLTSLTKLVWCDVQLMSPDGNMLRLLAAHQAMPIPPELSKLQQLEHLCIEYAQIDHLPPCVQALTNLRRLSLEGNAIWSLPEGHYLTSIEHLNLAANALQSLPEGLHVCRALRELSLARNPDLWLDPADVDRLVMGCTRLERLQLTECNGLLMGHPEEELRGLGEAEGEGEEEGEGPSHGPSQLLQGQPAASVPDQHGVRELRIIEELFPKLVAWGDDRAAWA